MQALHVETAPPPIEALYDGKCPLCQFGVKNYELDAQHGSLEVVDIRTASTLKDEAVAKGYNLDRSVVVKHGDDFYHAGDAIHFMAERAQHSSVVKRLIYMPFRSRSFSRAVYPVLRSIRLSLLWLRNIPKVHELDAERKESTIKKLMGDGFTELHSDVQRRFATEPTLRESVFYRGTMDKVECSAAGKIFAQCTRLIANPLTPHTGENVKMDVQLYRKTGLAGTYWRRTYYFEGRTPDTITSVKRQDSKGNMTECVGAGFGMVLNVSAEDGNLHFRSTRYFWEMGRFRINLPHWLSPGETHVIHENVDSTNFRFTITMTHPLLGRTFYQTGVFGEV